MKSKRRPAQGAALTDMDGGKRTTPAGRVEPLYGVELLDQHPDSAVVLVDNKQSADALRPFTPCVLAVLGEAPAWEMLAALRRRDVYCWPTNSQAGQQYMERVAHILVEQGAKAYTICTSEANAADFIAGLTGLQASDIRGRLHDLAAEAQRRLKAKARGAQSQTSRPQGQPGPTSAAKPQATTSSRVSKRRLAVVQVSDVAAAPVPWLWHGWITRGALAVVTGHPDVGKGWLTLALAAAFTRGWKLFGDPREQPQGKVLHVGAEDPIKFVIRPRLDSLGADVTMVTAVEGTVIGEGREQTFSLIEDLDLLDAELAKGGYVLVIIDPLNAYLGATLDTHRDASMRSVLTPLGKLAEKHDVAILAIIHPTKGAQAISLYRITGAVANSAHCRTALIVGRDEANDGELSPKRHVVLLKNNLMADEDKPKPICFELTKEHGFRWIGASTATADELLGTEEGGKGALTKVGKARAFLQGMLAAGPVPAAEAFQAARDAGIKPITLRRAADVLRVVKKKPKFESGWIWSLPPEGDHPGAPSGDGDLDDLQEVTLVAVDDNGQQAWRLVHPNGQNSDAGLFATEDAARQEAKARGWTITDSVEHRIDELEAIL